MSIDKEEAALLWEWINEICDVTTKTETAEGLKAKLAKFLDKEIEG
jgi:hypothetical protein